jgi:cytoplasmic FMR1 interacting protein
MSSKVTLEEAVNTVETLDEIALPDYQPCIEAINGSIVYKVSLDTNFEDKTAYVTGISKYIEEAAMHAQLVNIFLNYFKVNFIHLFKL